MCFFPFSSLLRSAVPLPQMQNVFLTPSRYKLVQVRWYSMKSQVKASDYLYAAQETEQPHCCFTSHLSEVRSTGPWMKTQKPTKSSVFLL